MAASGSWGRPADGPPPSGGSSSEKAPFGSSGRSSSFGSSSGRSSSGRSSFGSSTGRSSFGSSSGRSSFGSSTGQSSVGGQGARPRRRRKAEREAKDSSFGPVVGRSADLPPEHEGDAPGPWDSSDPGHAGEGAPGAARRSAAGRTTARGRRRTRAGDGAAGEALSGGPLSGGQAFGEPGPGEPAPAEPAPGKTRSGDSPDASDPLALARSIVLRQLAMAPRSRHQLATKLSERGVPPEAAAAVLDRFEEVQLIDDAEFARMWVRSRSATRSLARSSLKRELADKGVDPALAEDALAQVSDDDERDAARELIQRKLRPGADLSDRAARDKEIRRLVSMLARKGYAPGLAFALVKDALDERHAAPD
ncbi:regulatory protein RecX [Arthrobacter sp. TMN-37]